ncbi:alpha/beta-Hydrolases superfamily protein [Raphanus sativus]|uniref:Probable dipeptidyl-peptidase 5 n=1 Tax=Raphanus sativus TaxID=3726 RepID=A0A6J0KW16_RAPSA|nr:probable dipeptidyl-peptidase 5 [Raphanus sativus]XP_056856483.1 probable dipeptidyl-peptidase 5 [Raphanus sativus]KAJ4867532.1 alpha/beta-Hydrolases superfamily protein [Raphanus sativus]KAJ4917000.1 alpha/beta-Hydrolases superfamily protein [Raphanus sativus]
MSSSESPPQEKITAPYGSWKSPITADVVSGASKRLGGTAVDSRGRLVWLESRPNESGREVLVMEGEKEGGIDITPKEFGVRTLTQEYGGGAFRVSSSHDQLVVFSNYKDQRLYKQHFANKDSSPKPITPDYGSPAVTYADGVFDSRFNRFVTVREDGRLDRSNPITTIVEVNLSGGDTLEEPKVLVSGNDFYAFPRLDPKCERLAWIQWTLPNMPWDKAQLWVGYISESGTIDKRVCVAGCDPEYVESPTEPKWSPRGELFFVTDRKNGFWNIHKWIESTNEVVSVYPLDGEFTKPLWVFGTNSYEIIECSEEKNLIACSYRQKGKSYLGILDDSKGSCSLLDIPLTDFDNITLGNQCLYVEGASAVLPPSVAKVTLDKHKMKALSSEIVWSSSTDVLKYKSFFSAPDLIEFPTEVPGQNAYAYFYPPTNPLYNASIEEKPPLIVKSHGGPSAESRGSLNLIIQYWTSRGWAFVDVNYGGSTGYGREYRERVLRRWGIVDVDDCCGCAKYLVSSGKADVKRLFISGGSAGGYTALTALALRDVFKAGASLYGVADLKMLKEGHKFESRYIDSLVEEEKDFYERSPINFVDRFSCPIILFQGLEDKIVNPDQTRKIYQALKEKGVPVALVEYEGEEHGFRKAENIKYTLEQLMVFFARVVGGFQVADDITPLKIDNFDTSSDA